MPRDHGLTPAERYARFDRVKRQRRSIAAKFADTLPFELDRFQTDANEALEQGSNVLVAAPTGAGKTVVADFAVYLAQSLNVDQRLHVRTWRSSRR